MKPDQSPLIANAVTDAMEDERTRAAIGLTGLLGPFSTTAQFEIYLDHLDDLARRRTRVADAYPGDGKSKVPMSIASPGTSMA